MSEVKVLISDTTTYIDVSKSDIEKKINDHYENGWKLMGSVKLNTIPCKNKYEGPLYIFTATITKTIIKKNFLM